MATWFITGCSTEALTAALGKELAPLGVTVMAVEPGAFRTRYKRSLTQVRQTIDAYRGTVGVRRGEDLTEHDSQPGDPARAAEAIVAAVHSTAPPRLLILGPDALDWFHRSVDEINADVDAWRHTSLGTNFPEGL
jgi:NAD(P)-dependent dehydrogenase (short-subunit alcohol dehydrogenase family)